MLLYFRDSQNVGDVRGYPVKRRSLSVFVCCSTDKAGNNPLWTVQTLQQALSPRA